MRPRHLLSKLTLNHHNIKTLGVCLLLSVGLMSFGRGAYIQLKAYVAQWLIESAWQQQQLTGIPHKPWSWADTHPVAKLMLPGQSPLMVLSGVSGRNLAFGPTLQLNTAAPSDHYSANNSHGNVVIFGHNDTHFRPLGTLKQGDRLSLTNVNGQTIDYQITQMAIVDEHQVQVAQDTTEAVLTLITCYPFDSLSSGGPLRYVVRAERIAHFNAGSR
ncbi:hypothetical protein ABT56_11375 [Photobacterium aquae]|uniref:Sortase n=1 Tax=Photobacterium aquae TaxID=1195763 RepID=A0A0J1H156_9GAMM|nr:class GN sortase [Photobacterium aquae]KLV05558.1 hypothetical protein ABT56_11375 [Photobacterium aquae]